MLLGKLDRLRHVAELVNDEAERLLVVSHATEDKDHLGHELRRLADLVGLFERVVVGLPQERQQLGMVIFGIERHLQLVKVRADVRVLHEERVQVRVAQSTVVLELVHNGRDLPAGTQYEPHRRKKESCAPECGPCA